MKLVKLVNDILVETSVKSEDRVKLYEDERLLVVVPLTHKASCKYGAHTPWCVATPSNTEHYDYYRENGTFVFFIIKSPYPEAKIKEYKFAYYHSFTDEMIDESGWYDMSDFHYETPDPETDTRYPDMRLIKFLIPDSIFNLVKQYLSQYKKVFAKQEQERLQKGFQMLISDQDNHVIVNDSNWLIFYRTKPFPDYFIQFYRWSREPHFVNTFYVTYINKKTFKGVEQTIPYYYDIRGVMDPTIKNRQLFNFYKIGTMDEIDFIDTFKSYYKPISESYFKARQQTYNPANNDYFYLPSQFVTTEDYMMAFHEPKKIINLYSCNSHTSKICIDTIESKNAYYSDDTGVAVKYDPIRHNNPNL